MPDIEDLVGERLMIGLPGAEVHDSDLRLFEDTRAGGVILYRRNFRRPDDCVAMLARLDAAVGRRLLVGTDHEGGRVVMLGAGTTIFPDNLAVALSGDDAFAGRQGVIEGRELRRLGVDVNLAPVLDVLTDRYSPNIGIRSYGRDAKTVSRFGVARIRGMQRAGLAACAKHFPGKGHSPLDAHLRLPAIDSTWDDMRATHLVPFVDAIAAPVDAVMTSHPVYPNLDRSGVPATFSRRLVHELLREELAFGGVIVSDDLEMGAVLEVTSVGDAAIRAASAGHDLLLVCHTESAQRDAARSLVDAYRSGRLPRAELEAAADRVRRLRDARGERFAGGPPHAERDGAMLASALAVRAVATLAPGPSDLKRALNGRVAVVFPRFSDLAARITIEPAICDEREYLAQAFGQPGVAPDVTLVGIEPSEDEIRSAGEKAAAADVAVLFLFDAHLYPSNRALLDAVTARARRLAVVLLRDPYDASLVGPGALVMTAYGFRRCQLDAVISRLCYPESHDLDAGVSTRRI